VKHLAAALTGAVVLAGCDVGRAEPVEVPPAGTSFVCTPERLWDGDGPIWCKEGPRVRLAGIAAREVTWDGAHMRDTGCKPDHPCPTTDGVKARMALARLIVGENPSMRAAPSGHLIVKAPTLSCVSEGPAGGKRVAAWCRSPAAGDLSCAMVQGGYALRWERYWRDHDC
jgi:endonuclease YncB( thermonuclease family)